MQAAHLAADGVRRKNVPAPDEDQELPGRTRCSGVPRRTHRARPGVLDQDEASLRLDEPTNGPCHRKFAPVERDDQDLQVLPGLPGERLEALDEEGGV